VGPNVTGQLMDCFALLEERDLRVAAVTMHPNLFFCVRDHQRRETLVSVQIVDGEVSHSEEESIDPEVVKAALEGSPRTKAGSLWGADIYIDTRFPEDKILLEADPEYSATVEARIVY